MEYRCANRQEKTILFAWKVLLFLILCFPRILQLPKLILCLFIVGYYYLNKKVFYVEKNLFYYAILRILYTMLSVGIGLLYGNTKKVYAGAVRLGVIYTVLFIVIIQIVYNISGIIKNTIQIVAISNLYLGIYNISLVIGAYLRIGLPFLKSMDATSGAALHYGYSHIVSTNLSMSLITFPLGVYLINYFSEEEKKDTQTIKIFRMLSVVLCGFAMLLSGRRILWLCLAFTLLTYFIVLKRNIVTVLKSLGIIAVIITIFIIFDHQVKIINVEGITSRFISAFILDGGEETIRNIQARYLIAGFLEKPIFGNGVGAALEGFYRSKNSPWMFELSYHVVLFQSGIVGMILYLSALWILFRIIINTRSEDKTMYFACLISFISVLVANATNPYISSSFDFAIFLYLPVLLAKAVRFKG